MKEEASIASRAVLLAGLAFIRFSRICSVSASLYGILTSSDSSHLCPVCAPFRSQHANGRALFGLFVNASELLLEFRGVQLLAIDFVWDLEELILADGDDVGMFLVRVLFRVALWSRWYPAGVEHPPVARHGHWLLAHVLGL